MKLSECKTLEDLEKFKSSRKFVDGHGQSYPLGKICFSVRSSGNGFQWMEWQTFSQTWAPRDIELYNDPKEEFIDILQKAADNCTEKMERLKRERDDVVRLRNRALYEKASLEGRPEQELERFKDKMETGEISKEEWRDQVFHIL